MAGRAKLRFFTDHNVPDSIGNYLRGRGHSVVRLRHHMPDNSKDPVVATAALKDGRILITCDKDFNTQRFMQPRFEGLSRVALSGDGPTLLPAVKEHIETIEFQFALAQRKRAARLVAHVQVGQLRFRT